MLPYKQTKSPLSYVGYSIPCKMAYTNSYSHHPSICNYFGTGFFIQTTQNYGIVSLLNFSQIIYYFSHPGYYKAFGGIVPILYIKYDDAVKLLHSSGFSALNFSYKQPSYQYALFGTASIYSSSD